MTYTQFTTDLTNIGAKLEAPQGDNSYITLTIKKGNKQVIVDIIDHKSDTEENGTIYVDFGNYIAGSYINRTYDNYKYAMSKIKLFLLKGFIY